MGLVDLKVKIVGASGSWLEFLVECGNKVDLFFIWTINKTLILLERTN